MKLSLQLERNGNAGDVHDKTIPKLNAPIVARSKEKRDRVKWISHPSANMIITLR